MKSFVYSVFSKGVIAGLSLTCIAHGDEHSIDIVGKDGRSFRGVPMSLSDATLVVIRESDKKEFSLDSRTLTDETLERSRIVIKARKEQHMLDQKAKLDASRKALHAYSHRCSFGIITLYSDVADCALDKNGYNSGVTLLAPDRSKFHCYSLARDNVSSKAELREYVATVIQERMRGKTQSERENLLKSIEIREVNLGDWSGYEVVPSELLQSIRSLFLERDGKYFGFNHYGPKSASFYHKEPADISALKISGVEFERILKILKIE